MDTISNTKTKALNVVIIEDSINPMRHLQKILSGCAVDINIFPYETAQIFWDQHDAIKYPIDVAFIDIIYTDKNGDRAPGMDGVELVKRWRRREDGRYVRMVFTSSIRSDETELAGYDKTEGADDYWPKPFNKPNKIMKIERLMVSVAQLKHRSQDNTVQQTLDNLQTLTNPDDHTLCRKLAVAMGESPHQAAVTGALYDIINTGLCPITLGVILTAFMPKSLTGELAQRLDRFGADPEKEPIILALLQHTGDAKDTSSQVEVLPLLSAKRHLKQILKEGTSASLRAV